MEFLKRDWFFVSIVFIVIFVIAFKLLPTKFSEKIISLPRASGGGTELLWGIYPSGTIVRSNFAFNDNFFTCVVETNTRPIEMEIFAQVGDNVRDRVVVSVPQHGFFMSIESEEIYERNYTTTPTSEPKFVMKGIARSITQVGIKPELLADFDESGIPFTLIAVDGGPGNEEDAFVLIMDFDEETSPGQLSLFGNDARFGGRIINGDILIENVL